MQDLSLLRYPNGAPLDPKFNDIELSGYDFTLIDGPTRKQQDVVKILVTAIQSNLAYPLYGSDIPTLVPNRSFPDLQSKIKNSVIQALGFVQDMEASTDPAERISKIVSLNISQNKQDTRRVTITLVVGLESGDTVTATIPHSNGN